MMYSNKLDLNYFFYNLRDLKYVIIKLKPYFPNYYEKSDIDILCENNKKFAQRILYIGNKFISNNFKIEVEDTEEHTHIDFYYNDILDFRFDINKKIPEFDNIKISQYYLYSIIDNRKYLTKNFDKKKYKIFIPATLDEMIIRYLEYLQLYKTRPDKVKHLDYVNQKIEEQQIEEEFFDRLHLYIKLNNSKNKDGHIRSYIISRFFSLPLYYMKKIKSKGIIGTLKAIKNKINN